MNPTCKQALPLSTKEPSVYKIMLMKILLNDSSYFFFGKSCNSLNEHLRQLLVSLLLRYEM